MTYAARIAFLLASMAYSALLFADTQQTTPDWLQSIVSSHSKSKKYGVNIAEYKYKNRTVYVVDESMNCCDIGATMYTETGEKLCSFIGIVGSWEDSCKDFPSTKVLIKVIYERHK